MPFTFSHPAAIVPLNRLLKDRSSLTALIIGSIAPDFEYFFRLTHRSAYSHTWAGLFWFNLPVGLFLCFVYHNLIRDAFYYHAPLFLKQRMAAYRKLDWNEHFASNWRSVLLCLFLASLSHQVWDRLLHHSMQLTQLMTGLRAYTTPDVKREGYYLWWWLHSGMGGFLVLFSFWNMPKAKHVLPNTHVLPYWLCFFATSAAAMTFQLRNIMIIPDTIAIALINSLFLGCLSTSTLFAFRWGGQKAKIAFAAKEKG